jgi:hypothetical protein
LVLPSLTLLPFGALRKGAVQSVGGLVSTQSFTQQFIENRKATTIQDVLLYDPSISAAQGARARPWIM